MPKSGDGDGSDGDDSDAFPSRSAAQSLSGTTTFVAVAIAISMCILHPACCILRLPFPGQSQYQYQYQSTSHLAERHKNKTEWQATYGRHRPKRGIRIPNSPITRRLAAAAGDTSRFRFRFRLPSVSVLPISISISMPIPRTTSTFTWQGGRQKTPFAMSHAPLLNSAVKLSFSITIVIVKGNNLGQARWIHIQTRESIPFNHSQLALTDKGLSPFDATQKLCPSYLVIMPL